MNILIETIAQYLLEQGFKVEFNNEHIKVEHNNRQYDISYQNQRLAVFISYPHLGYGTLHLLEPNNPNSLDQLNNMLTAQVGEAISEYQI